ncbi:MAG: LEM-3-like GIY-YIG domain-containing protein [Bacteroidales bacterium]
MKFSHSVLNELKYYVYIYSHPETNVIFYVGKGKGNRVFSHLCDKSESKKVQYIDELHSLGLIPKIEILIHGLENEEIALKIESAIIDLIGMSNLTNIQRGYKSASFGRMTIDQIKSLYDKQEINIDDPSILIRINKAFRYSMTETELYDYTRGRWKIDPQRAKNAKYGFAVFEGVIQEVYEIAEWHKAGTTESVRQQIEKTGLNTEESLIGRYEFTGNIAPQAIREKYRFMSVEHYFKKGNSNPIMYINA